MALQELVRDMENYHTIGTSSSSAHLINMTAFKRDGLYRVEVNLEFDRDFGRTDPNEVYDLARDFGGDHQVHLRAQRWINPGALDPNEPEEHPYVFEVKFGTVYVSGVFINRPKTNKEKKVLKRIFKHLGVAYSQPNKKMQLSKNQRKINIDPETLRRAYEELPEEFLPLISAGTENSSFSIIHVPAPGEKNIRGLQLMLQESSAENLDWQKLDKTIERNGIILDNYTFD